MNAIEMAVKAVLEKTLPGMAERLLSNLPPEVIETIGLLGKTAVSLKAQLDRIEARLIRIEEKIGLSLETMEHDDVRSAGTNLPGD